MAKTGISDRWRETLWVSRLALTFRFLFGEDLSFVLRYDGRFQFAFHLRLLDNRLPRILRHQNHADVIDVFIDVSDEVLDISLGRVQFVSELLLSVLVGRTPLRSLLCGR